jgi:hypothetical protein
MFMEHNKDSYKYEFSIVKKDEIDPSLYQLFQIIVFLVLNILSSFVCYF